MLKKRIIAALPIYEGIVVQSIGFKKYLPVGKPEIAVEYLNRWGIDEIIINDISATRSQSELDFDLYKRVSKKCFVPLTIGGGLSNIDQIDQLIHGGADKVCINNSFLKKSGLVNMVAKNYGAQSVVVSIDVKRSNGSWYVYNYIKNDFEQESLIDTIKRAQAEGAGEIFINSVDNDGKYCGYDIALFNTIISCVNVPLLACGGAKSWESIFELFNKTNVSAACVGNYFHFSEHQVVLTKKMLIEMGLKDIRLESLIDYNENELTKNGRLLKKSDMKLNELLYSKIFKEII